MICCLAVPSPATKLWRSLRFLAVGMLCHSLPRSSTSVLLSLSTMLVPPLPSILLWWLAKSSSRRPRKSLAQLQTGKNLQSLKMEIPKNPGSKRSWNCLPHLQPGTHVSWVSEEILTVHKLLNLYFKLLSFSSIQIQTNPDRSTDLQQHHEH